MEVEVRIQDSNTHDAVRNYVIRRIRFAIGRFASRVGRVVVRTHDTNGVRGGVDQSCHVAADVVRGGKIVIEQTDSDLFTAIDRACNRLAEAFHRELERSRDSRTAHASVRHMAL